MRAWGRTAPEELAERLARRSRSRDSPSRLDASRSNRATRHQNVSSRRVARQSQNPSSSVINATDETNRASATTRRFVERSRSRDDSDTRLSNGGSNHADVGGSRGESVRMHRTYGALRAWGEECPDALPRAREEPDLSQVLSNSHREKQHTRETRYTGRERFEEGHDNRCAGNFEEYYTPRIRPYSHRERWEAGHDDRDGYKYSDHAPSVRPITDFDGFARHWYGR